MVTRPLFIKVEHYKELLDIMDFIKARISDIEKDIENLKSLRDKEANEIESWSSRLEEVKAKLDSIYGEVFTPE